MHLHILGICGTFMGSLALLARELGHQVSGSDANVYPPMSTQLEAQGIELDKASSIFLIVGARIIFKRHMRFRIQAVI